MKTCTYCNDPISQGHRKDRCKNSVWKTRGISNNKMYMSPKYKDDKYEVMDIPNSKTMVLTTSGARTVGGVVSGAEYLQDIKNTIDFLQYKVNKIEAGNKKNNKK